MSDTDFDKDQEWLEALEVEPAGDDSGGAADDTNDDNKKGDNDESQKEEGANNSADKGAEANDGDGESDGKPDGTGERGDNGEAADETKNDKPEAAEDTKELSTKEAVKEALQEIETTKADQANRTEAYKADVTKAFYPEGIDRTLRDSDGDPITGIDDLTKLINPDTQEYFTDEEAGRWLLSAQQKLNQDIQTVEKFIEDVAETNMQLEDGAARVVEKYGDILAKNPELKDRLLASYNKTVVKDPNTGIAIKAPVDVLDFFDPVLEPMLAAQSAQVEADAKAAKEAADKAAKDAQSDRGDLKQSGKADVIPPADREWAQAIKDYEEGV